MHKKPHEWEPGDLGESSWGLPVYVTYDPRIENIKDYQWDKYAHIFIVISRLKNGHSYVLTYQTIGWVSDV